MAMTDTPTASIDDTSDVLEQDPRLTPVFGVTGMSQFLAISVRQTWRLLSAGKLPAPLRIGNSVRWRREEVLDWLAAGAPERVRWEEMKGSK